MKASFLINREVIEVNFHEYFQFLIVNFCSLLNRVFSRPFFAEKKNIRNSISLAPNTGTSGLNGLVMQESSRRQSTGLYL